MLGRRAGTSLNESTRYCAWLVWGRDGSLCTSWLLSFAEKLAVGTLIIRAMPVLLSWGTLRGGDGSFHRWFFFVCVNFKWMDNLWAIVLPHVVCKFVEFLRFLDFFFFFLPSAISGSVFVSLLGGLALSGPERGMVDFGACDWACVGC